MPGTLDAMLGCDYQILLVLVPLPCAAQKKRLGWWAHGALAFDLLAGLLLQPLLREVGQEGCEQAQPIAFNGIHHCIFMNACPLIMSYMGMSG